MIAFDVHGHSKYGFCPRLPYTPYEYSSIMVLEYRTEPFEKVLGLVLKDRFNIAPKNMVICE